MSNKFYLLAGLLLLSVMPCRAQQASGTLSEQSPLPDKLIEGLGRRVSNVQESMVQQAGKYFKKLLRREQALKNRLAKKDTAAASRIFGEPGSFYNDLNQQIQKEVTGRNNPFTNVYSSRLDSLKTGLLFLDKTGVLPPAANGLLSKYNELQATFNRTEAVKRLLTERQQALQQQLENLGIPGVKALQKRLYYFRAQMDEYKRLWENPSELERKLTRALCNIPEFKQFFDQFSDLGAVFQLPGNTSSLAVNSTLQTRDALNQLIGVTTGSPGNVQSQIQNNIPAPSAQGNVLQPDFPTLGGDEGSESTMSGFTPNHQKTKSWRKRLEFGTTLQSTRAGYFFPATTDIGLSVGYRLNDKSIVGVGGSGKIGWGRGWSDIQLTGQGLSIRSFADIKLKGNIWVSGGWEYHYQQPEEDARTQFAISNWKQSGLIGISKIIPVKTNAFNKYRIQLFYDFLYKYKLPVTEPFKFRIGYVF